MEQGVEASLAEILGCREKRAGEQRRLLAEHGKPLVSFTVNMPGPVKLCPESRYIHKRGLAQLKDALRRAGISVVYETARETPGGPEAFLVADAPAISLKEITCAVEDETPLGRLFDMDVLDPAIGRSLMRESVSRPRRACLLCGEEAAICARSRAHSVGELVAKIKELVEADKEGDSR